MSLRSYFHAFRQSPALANTSWLLVEKVITMILALIVSVLMARSLGPEGFGVVTYVIAVFTLISPLSALGLNAIVTKELVLDKQSSERIMSTVLFYRILGGVVTLFAVFIMLKLEVLTQLKGYEWAIILLAVVNVFTALHVIDFWFQAKVLSKYIALSRLIVVLFFTLVKCALVYLDLPIERFLQAIIVEYLFICIGFAIVYYHKNGKFSVFNIDYYYGFSLLKKSVWLILSGVASVIYLKIDQVMLAEMVSTTETGIYAVASRLSEVWYFFATILVTSYFPSLLKLKQNNGAGYQAKLQKLNDALFICALLIAIFMYFFGELLIVTLFGHQYAAAGIILVIHIWASIFVYMRALLSKWLIAENLFSFSLLTQGIGAIVNIVLNIYFIPLWGGIGAAAATVISYACAGYLSLFLLPATRPMAYIMTKSIFLPLRVFLNRVKFVS